MSPRPDDLARAIEDGDRERVDALLGEGASPEALDARGMSPLWLAVHVGDAEIARRLVDAGARASGELVDRAVALGDDEMTAVVVAALDGPARDREAGHSLVWAAHVHDERAVTRLLARGVALAAPVADAPTLDVGGAALLAALARSGGRAAALALLAAGASVDRADARGSTPLMRAAALDDDVVVEALLARGADPTHVDARGRNALHHARAGLASAAVARLVRAARERLGPTALVAWLARSPDEARFGLGDDVPCGSFLAATLDSPLVVLGRGGEADVALARLLEVVGMPRARTGPYVVLEVISRREGSEAPYDVRECARVDDLVAPGSRVLLRELPPDVDVARDDEPVGRARLAIVAVGDERELERDDARLAAGGRRLLARVASLCTQEDGYVDACDVATVSVDGG